MLSGPALPSLALLAAGGAAATGALAWLAARWLGPRGWMDDPGPRKLHRAPTPRTGGLALWAGLLLGQGLGLLDLPIAPVEWLALHALALMGALDDRHRLAARTKALAGLGIALALAIPVAQAFAADRPAALLLKIWIPTDPPYLTLPLLVLWFWGVPQAFNLIDGLDGLATGLALVIAALLLPGRGLGGTPFLLGALAITFLLNWPRPRHFLGDCGAYFLGGLLALLALRTRAFQYPSLALWVFAYPILDMLQVILIRLLRRQPLGAGDRNHLHHHWTRLIGEPGALVVLLAQAAALAVGPTGFRGSGWLCWSALALMAVQMAVFIAWALRHGAPDAQRPQA